MRLLRVVLIVLNPAARSLCAARFLMHLKIPILLLLPLLVGIWYYFTGFQNLPAAVFFGVLTWLLIVCKEAFTRWLEKRAAPWVHRHRHHPVIRWIEKHLV